MENNTPEISIIIPAYNAGKYINDSITSVIKQSFSSWELIVIDDGSTDDTASIAKSYLHDKRIRLIQQENKGVSAARNKGLRNAKGKYVGFLDADDWFFPTNLELKCKKLANEKDIDFVYSDISFCKENLEPTYIEQGSAPEGLAEQVLLWGPGTIPNLPSNLVVRDTVIKAGLFFDENLSNCADRYYKIQVTQKYKGGYVGEALVKIRDVPASMSKKVWLLEKDELYIISKIRELNIVPPGPFRQRIISNIYMVVSGSWHKNAGNTSRAILFGFKAILAYPPAISRILKKIL